MNSKTRSILRTMGIAAVMAVVMVAVAALVVRQVRHLFVPPLPQIEATKTEHLPNSDWTPEERQWYYHSSQGSRLMPYRWFVHLEQAGSEKPFLDPAHIAQFRLIPDSNRENNPDHLPVGFARDCRQPVDPTDLDTEYVGMTCATCHTGQITYQGTRLLIDGAPSQFDAAGFLLDLGLAISETEVNPAKFDRFARKVLAGRYNSITKNQLHEQVTDYVDEALIVLQPAAFMEAVLDSGRYTHPGPGRVDAMGQGSNILLGKLSTKNVRTLDAPVDILPLWYAYSYGWVQTNAAIRQPMARNIVESLSVFADVDLQGASGDAQRAYLSSVRLKNLWMMESMATRLKAPEWPAQFGVPDPEKARRGQVLYQELCAKCHEPRLETPSSGSEVPVVGPPPNFPPDPVSEEAHRRFYYLPLFGVDEIGTDPLDAVNFADREVDATAIGLGAKEPVGKVIQPLIEGVMQRYYTDHKVPQREQIKWNGDRGNYWRTPKAYPARPLAGIWATAPFLHNGSVPNLYELLSPVEERSKTFYRGGLEFDPVRVGFKTGQLGFVFYTSWPGNSHAGHEFRDGEGKGVIGRRLTEGERWQIIEYLKVLRFEPEVEPEWNPPTDWLRSAECPQPDTSQTSGGDTGSHL
jgi:hypothetical protein